MLNSVENSIYTKNYNISSTLTKTPRFGSNNDHNSRVFNAQAVEATAGGLGAAALLRFIQYCIENLSKVCSYALMRGKEFTTKDNIDKIVQIMKRENNLDTEVHFLDEANKDILKKRLPQLENDLDVVAAGKNAFFTDAANLAVAPKSKPSLILHELGHATNYAKKGFMHVLQKMRIFGMYAPAAVAALNSLSGGKIDGKQNFIERNAGTIGFLAMLPTIIEEGAASVRGINAAKKANKILGSNIKLGALKRNYFFAWMTYLLGGIGVAVATKLAVVRE